MGTLGNAFSNATKSTLTPDERIGWPKAPATPDDGIGMPKAPAKAPQPLDSTKVPVFSNTELTAEQIDLLLKSAHEFKPQAPTVVNYASYIEPLQKVSVNDSMSLSENTKNWLLAQEALGNIPIKEGETKSFMLPETMSQDMQDYIKTHENLEAPGVTSNEPGVNDQIGGILNRVPDIGCPTPVFQAPEKPTDITIERPNDIGMTPHSYPTMITLNEEQTRILLERFANHQFQATDLPRSMYMNMSMINDIAPNLGLDDATYMWIASQLQSNSDFKVPFPEGTESISMSSPSSVANDISDYMQANGHGDVGCNAVKIHTPEECGNTYEDLVRSGFKMPEAPDDDIDCSELVKG